MRHSDGAASAPARIVDHDDRWSESAQRWLRRIQAAVRPLAGPAELRVDHIGSTAVPGLAAKPILDLQVLLPVIPEERTVTALLEPLGMQRAQGARPDSPGVSADIPRPGSDPAHHEKLLYVANLDERVDHASAVILHIRRRDSAFADFVLSFRDWLRAEPDRRDQYAQLKRELAETFHGAADYDDYTRAKSAFMDEAQSAMDWPSHGAPEHRARLRRSRHEAP